MSRASPPRAARDAARADLTGNWVAQVTEDWRMIAPPKGDFAYRAIAERLMAK